MLKKLSAMLTAVIAVNSCLMNLSMITTKAASTAGSGVKAYSSNISIGDVDSNSTVDVLDAASILTEAATLGTATVGNFTEEQYYCADVNGDEMMDAIDASLILTYSSYLGSGGTDDLSVYLEQMGIINAGSSGDVSQDVSGGVEESDGLTGNKVALTADECTMLAALVTLEAGNESYECQKAVASLLINRMITSGSTLSEVIYAKNQFSTASRVTSTTPFTSCVNAVSEVVANGTTIPVYVTFFRASYYHSWGDQVAYCCIDNTYFSYSQALKNKYV